MEIFRYAPSPQESLLSTPEVRELFPNRVLPRPQRAARSPTPQRRRCDGTGPGRGVRREREGRGGAVRGKTRHKQPSPSPEGGGTTGLPPGMGVRGRAGSHLFPGLGHLHLVQVIRHLAGLCGEAGGERGRVGKRGDRKGLSRKNSGNPKSGRRPQVPTFCRRIPQRVAEGSSRPARRPTGAARPLKTSHRASQFGRVPLTPTLSKPGVVPGKEGPPRRASKKKKPGLEGGAEGRGEGSPGDYVASKQTREKRWGRAGAIG